MWKAPWTQSLAATACETARDAQPVIKQCTDKYGFDSTSFMESCVEDIKVIEFHYQQSWAIVVQRQTSKEVPGSKLARANRYFHLGKEINRQ